ncbi:MAG: SDR family oxidoreductase [Lapillicoccus sp.]
MTTRIRLDDKVVVVTGAGRGLGAAYARHLAALGARVVVADVDADVAEETTASIRQAGGQAVVHVGSVADPAVADSVVDAAVQRWGRLDGLVNNAGIFYASTIAAEEPDRVRRLLEVNVLGTVYCGLAALRRMLEQGWGSLVNITSGSQSGTAGLAVYSASKGAVASLTYSWALEVAGSGVRVNALSPNAGTRMADTYEAWRGRTDSGQNLGKPPSNNAPALAYLLSDASARLNGQVLRVDGGELAVVGHPRPLAPPAVRDAWTVDAVAEAVAGELDGQLQPLGLSVDGS